MSTRDQRASFHDFSLCQGRSRQGATETGGADMLPYLTTDKTSTQIHCCYYGKKSTGCNFTLPCGLETINGKPAKVKTIVPSSLYFMKKGMPDDWKVYIHGQNPWRVVHSMHASYNKIRDVVGYLRPKNIYPFVPPVETFENSDLGNKTNLGSDDLSWRETLHRKSATNSAKNEIDDDLGLSSPKKELRSPPPKNKTEKTWR